MMGIPEAGSTETGEYWTIQHRSRGDTILCDRWVYSNYDNIASPAYRDSLSAKGQYGAHGFLTKALALIALANVRAHSPNKDDNEFRIVHMKFTIAVHLDE